ncbi:MAG: hypothetical protein ABIQ27_11495 [Flavobacterium sp.]|uniref:hypothetical protein n=1 Tax=Flavobacterium sp. TaxID=239 RepID=UPI0032635D90
MKLAKILLTAIFLIALNSAQAQTKTLTFPDWGVAGYDVATYYYIPATETYYDIKNKEYVYMREGKWVRSNTMPVEYVDYDLYNGYKVVLTDENEPFPHYNYLKSKYPKTYKGKPQKTIKPKK